jgi:hypothetical protein
MPNLEADWRQRITRSVLSPSTEQMYAASKKHVAPDVDIADHTVRAHIHIVADARSTSRKDGSKRNLDILTQPEKSQAVKRAP